MTHAWRDDQPIYRQIRDRVIASILDGSLKEGEPLPSVRVVAVDLQVNPLTVSKAYQELADDGWVERRRGLGMFVIEGARNRLSLSEREQFLKQEWPGIVARIIRLDINPVDLINSIPAPRDKGEDQ
jgi:GntR family transcriptional regulator